jgi:hypothetical protein
VGPGDATGGAGRQHAAGHDGRPRRRQPGNHTVRRGVQAQITFDYFHVLPALDLAPFIAADYGIGGRSSVDGEMVGGAGNVTVDVQATWRTVLHLEMRATDFIGSATEQPLADRSFFAFNVRGTF